MRAARNLGRYVSALRAAAGSNALEWPHQAARIALARLRYGIGPHYYSLFDLRAVPESKWGDYVLEYPFDRIARRLNAPADRKFADDKLAFEAHCRAHGCATVPILAVIGDDPSPSGAHERIADAARLGDFLARHPEPLFFKRIDGSHGEGAFAVERAAEGIRFGTRVGTAANLFAACRDQTHVWAKGTSRYIIQPRIALDLAVASIMSSTGVGTVRAMTFLTRGVPRLLFACLRITARGNPIDNFVYGTQGNLVAGLDPETGTIVACVGSRRLSWPDMVDVSRHPDTGREIVGFTLPRWREARELVLAAAASFPTLQLIGWDVTLTRDGPSLLEANVQPAIYLNQIALKRGLRQELYAALLEELTAEELARVETSP